MWIGLNDKDTLTGSIVLENLSDCLSKINITSSYQTIDRLIVRDFWNNMWHYEGRFESKKNDFYISAMTEWSLGPNYLIIEAEYESVDLAIGIRTYWTDQNIPTSISNAKAKQQYLGFFVKDDCTLRKDLNTNIGLRFSKYESKYEHKGGPNYQDIKDRNKSH
jgi:hypothetical protein